MQPLLAQSDTVCGSVVGQRFGIVIGRRVAGLSAVFYVSDLYTTTHAAADAVLVGRLAEQLYHWCRSPRRCTWPCPARRAAASPPVLPLGQPRTPSLQMSEIATFQLHCCQQHVQPAEGVTRAAESTLSHHSAPQQQRIAAAAVQA